MRRRRRRGGGATAGPAQQQGHAFGRGERDVRVQVDDVGREHQGGLAEVGQLGEERVEGAQGAVAWVAVAAGDVGLASEPGRPGQPAEGDAQVRGDGPGPDAARRWAQGAELPSRLHVPVPGARRAEEPRPEGVAALGAGALGEGGVLALEAEVVQIGAERLAEAGHRAGAVGAPEGLRGVAPVVQGAVAAQLDGTRGEGVETVAATLPDRAGRVEGAADVRALAHGNQPLRAEGEFVPAGAQGEPVACGEAERQGELGEALDDVEGVLVGGADRTVAAEHPEVPDLREDAEVGPEPQIPVQQETLQQIVVAARGRRLAQAEVGVAVVLVAPASLATEAEPDLRVGAEPNPLEGSSGSVRRAGSRRQP